MPAVERMSVALTPEMAALVRNAVEDGAYASVSEVFRDALRHWKYREQARHAEVEEMRRLWHEADQDGPAKLLTREVFEQIKADGRKRLKDEASR